MSPDAIIVLSGGTVKEEYPEIGTTRYRSTSYEEQDAFGALGSRSRVEAAAILAKKYPDAMLATTAKRATGEPTHAAILADELVAFGVARERIVLEEKSENTQSQLEETLALARARGWKHLTFISNEYHLPRLNALYEKFAAPDVKAVFTNAEAILAEQDPAFAAHFALVRKTPAYQKRLESEARGLEALRYGTYQAAPLEDKLER